MAEVACGVKTFVILESRKYNLEALGGFQLLAFQQRWCLGPGGIGEGIETVGAGVDGRSAGRFPVAGLRITTVGSIVEVTYAA